MVALMLFNRNLYKWEVWSVSLYDDISVSAKSLRRRFSNHGMKTYTHIIDVEIKEYKIKTENGNSKYTVILADDEKLPKTPTLEESIEECKKVLSGMLNN